MLHRVLTIAAAPDRLLLLLRHCETGTTAAVFLQRGDSLIRFAAGGGGCLLSTPSTRRDLAYDLCRLLAIGGGGPTDTMATTPRRLIAAWALHCQRMAGGPARMTRAKAIDVLRPALPEGRSPAELLEALVEDGALTIADDEVEVSGPWLEQLDFVFDSEQTRLYAIEVNDRSRSLIPRHLVILGRAERRRLAFSPTHVEPAPDRRVVFMPANAGTVRAAIAALTSAPPGPPDAPRAGRREASTGSFEPSSRRVGQRSDGGSWRFSLPQQIAPGATDGRVPRALVEPVATVQLFTRSAGADQRRTISISSGDAAEWSMDGSVVRWRPLTRDELGASLDELLPPSAGLAGETAPVEIDAVTFAGLISGRLGDERAAELPVQLRVLAGARDCRWSAIRVLTSQPSGVKGIELLVATCDASRLLRFERAGASNMRVASVDRHSVHRELIAALRG